MQVEASTFWKTFWWELVSMKPNKKLKCFRKKNIFELKITRNEPGWL